MAMNSVLCFVDFLRMTQTRPDYAKGSQEDWENFVYDVSPLILNKWGF